VAERKEASWSSTAAPGGTRAALRAALLEQSLRIRGEADRAEIARSGGSGRDSLRADLDLVAIGVRKPAAAPRMPASA